jgi:hypothetical protein
MKFLILMLASGFTLSAAAFAPQLSVKERLRLQLWAKGLSEERELKRRQHDSRPRFPEELERPLRNL